MTTDTAVVSAITSVAERHQLLITTRRHGASFCTVYLSRPSGSGNQRTALREAQADLVNSGVYGSVMTSFHNKEHPRHNDPLLEIDSVWWPK